MFYVILAGAVIVLGGVLSAIDLTVAGDVDDALARRVELSGRLSNLTARPQVNDAVRDNERKRVETIKTSAVEILARSRDWNSRNYKVLQLPVVVDGKEIRRVPAFPIDSDEYTKFGLSYVFTQEYRKTLLGMISSMAPASLPTQEDFNNEVVVWEKRLKMLREQQERQKRSLLEGPAAGAGEQPPSPAIGLGVLPSYVRPGGAVEVGEAVPSDIAIQARQMALESIKMKKASEGWIYLSESCLDMIFLAPETNPPNNKLWDAQVNLWLTQDIMRAISATNDAVLAKVPKPQQNVTTAAVKRLVKIDIEERYYGTGTGTGVPGVPARPAFGTGTAGPVAVGPGGTGSVVPPGVPPGMVPGYVPGGQEITTLTQRVTNQKFEVVHYSFSVVMPLHHLHAFQQNLLQQNYHTILKVSMDSVDEGLDAGAQAGAAQGATVESLYYYGPDPVMRVTFDCELLLLTDWARGLWDEQNNKWSSNLPPLVPVEVLRQIQAGIPSAIRPADERRLLSAR